MRSGKFQIPIASFRPHLLVLRPLSPLRARRPRPFSARFGIFAHFQFSSAALASRTRSSSGTLQFHKYHLLPDSCVSPHAVLGLVELVNRAPPAGGPAAALMGADASQIFMHEPMGRSLISSAVTLCVVIVLVVACCQT